MMSAACSSAEPESTPTENDARIDETGADSSSDASVDSRIDDDATDSTSVDSAPETIALPDVVISDSLAPCFPGSKESIPCGKCGASTRVCGSDAKWGPFLACIETAGECTPGETRPGGTCGKCGSRTESCTSFCKWVGGLCTGEGTCTPGDVETDTTSCTVPFEIKSRTCSSTCGFGAWSACYVPKGWQAIALPPTTFPGRWEHSATWTGSQMIVFGGQTKGTGWLDDAAAFDRPTNTWKTLAKPSIAARSGHTAIWTGTKMIVWGGRGGSLGTVAYDDGAIFDPSTGWSSMASAPIAPRYNHFAAWSSKTSEMIVWGGNSTGITVYADGAAYKPSTNTWRTLAAPSGIRNTPGVAWGGDKLVRFAGYCGFGAYCTDSDVYDPVTDLWTTTGPMPTSVRAGPLGFSTGAVAAYLFGTDASGTTLFTASDGATYDPATGKYVKIPKVTVVSSDRGAFARWSGGGGLYFWGGIVAKGTSALADGAVFDLATATWTKLPTVGAPIARGAASAVWTGTEAIVWGGYPGGSGTIAPLSDGKIYRP